VEQFCEGVWPVIATLDEIVSKSGDSEFLQYCYDDGKLIVELEIDELDMLAVFNISTKTVTATSISDKDLPYRTCYINLFKLSETLTRDKGRYLPATDFPTLMKHEREGINLAYGKKVDEVEFILQFRGTEVILACLIENKGDIQVNLKD
jgi:hypothetical protein